MIKEVISIFWQKAIEKNFIYQTLDSFPLLDFSPITNKLKTALSKNDNELVFNLILSLINPYIKKYTTLDLFILDRLTSKRLFCFASTKYAIKMLFLINSGLNQPTQQYMSEINYGLCVNRFFTMSNFKLRHEMSNFYEDYFTMIFWESCLASGGNIILKKIDKNIYKPLSHTIGEKCLSIWDIVAHVKYLLGQQGIEIGVTHKSDYFDSVIALINKSPEKIEYVEVNDTELLLDYDSISSYVGMLFTKYQAIEQLFILQSNVDYNNDFWNKFIKKSINFNSLITATKHDKLKIENYDGEVKTFNSFIEALANFYLPFNSIIDKNYKYRTIGNKKYVENVSNTKVEAVYYKKFVPRFIKLKDEIFNLYNKYLDGHDVSLQAIRLTDSINPNLTKREEMEIKELLFI
jgi:hypothetical protein